MYWLLVLLVYCALTFGIEKDDCLKQNKLRIYQDYGNITITGNRLLISLKDTALYHTIVNLANGGI